LLSIKSTPTVLSKLSGKLDLLTFSGAPEEKALNTGHATLFATTNSHHVQH
jgi:hypothetical protein